MARTSFGKFAANWDIMANGDSKAKSPTIGAVFSLLGALKGRILYDVACGNGILARQMVERGTREVWASDVSSELIEMARSKYDATGITYLVKEATNMRGIPRSYFDAVIVHQGMFYIKDIDTLLKGVAKILKPGGMMVFTLLHPLFPDAYSAMGDVVDVPTAQKKYLTVYSKMVHKEWDEVDVSYLTYRRPLNFYINLCGKHGLYLDKIEEPRAQSVRNGKRRTSDIPASIILRVRRIE